MLTKRGKSYAARMASSLLQSVGLTDLITTTESQYENLAMKLAQDPEQLSALKERLSANRITKLYSIRSYLLNIWKKVTGKLTNGTAMGNYRM